MRTRTISPTPGVHPPRNSFLGATTTDTIVLLTPKELSADTIADLGAKLRFLKQYTPVAVWSMFAALTFLGIVFSWTERDPNSAKALFRGHSRDLQWMTQ